MGIGKLFHVHALKGMFDETDGGVKGFGLHPKERFVWDGVGTSDRKKYGKTNTGYRLGEKGTFAKHSLWEPATNAPSMFAAPNLPKGKVILILLRKCFQFIQHF